jgi:flagellin-like protein
MKYIETIDDSAVSPVIGVILMVAITVILAAVIGTFVLGVGNAQNEPANAGVSVEKGPGESVTITVVDTGNLDALRVVGPNGGRSAPFFSGGFLQTGTKIEIREGGFAPRSIKPAVEPDGSPMDLVNGGLAEDAGPVYADILDQPNLDTDRNQLDADLTLDGKDVSINESCKVQVPRPGAIRGLDINGRSPGTDARTSLRPEIGCSLRNLQGYLIDTDVSSFGDTPIVGGSISNADAKARSLDVGSPVTYKEGEYKLVGTVDGEDQVFQTFTIEG